jgi:spore coat polysaccharide biosynthesis protein SpsF
MSVVAIIQARMGSTRLRGKSLVEIEGRPLLSHIIERVRESQKVDEIVVATTNGSDDLAIVRRANEEGVSIYRGSDEDVLDRFFRAAEMAAASTIVRITADDPFKDPAIIDLVVGALLIDPQLDYVSNTIRPTFPEGLDVEAFTMAALETAWREARLPSEREHVTPYIWTHPERFHVRNIENSQDFSALRWTLDYEADLQFAREIYRRLYKGKVFYMNDVLSLLRREPSLGKINEGIVRNAAYLAFREKDGA